MNDKKKDIFELLADLEKIYFFSQVDEKERPPISPVPNETRELAKRSLVDLRKNLEKRQQKVKDTEEKFELDGSRLSGVKSGDLWKVNKEGNLDRYFELNEGLLEGLLQRRTERVADPDRDISIDLLLQTLSYAQWAPNATNEQPTKIMVYKKDHPSMHKIGELMHQALYERIMPNINIRNYILNKKKEQADFLPQFSLQDLIEMKDEELKNFNFEDMPAPLDELPQTADKLMERNKIMRKDGKYYKVKGSQQAQEEFTIKDLLANDRTFAKGMGMFSLKFKNTHPYLIVIFRKWHYTSLMTETLNKYGIEISDVGEEFIDAGFYTDHLALSARGLGLSGVVKTGPLDLAKDELTELFIQDLKGRIKDLENILKGDKQMPARRKKILQKEIAKARLLSSGLGFGLEALRCTKQNRPFRNKLLVALKRGEVYIPATFFQMGYPLPILDERVRDPRQGKNPLENMIIFLGE